MILKVELSLFVKSDAFTAYDFGSEERVRPNKWAATALLSRVFLYSGDWVNAETEATKVISNLSEYDLVPLEDVFLKNNREAIWQLQTVGSGTNSNTGEGRLFILPVEGPSATFPIYLIDLRPIFLDFRPIIFQLVLKVAAASQSASFPFAF